MGRELELKYRASQEQIGMICSQYGPFFDIAMETTYFDTPDRRLGARRATLRRRLENGAAVYALKTFLPDGSHGEWETEADSNAEAYEKLCKLGAPDVPHSDLWQSICGARFTRSCALLSVPGGKVELAVDRGVLLGGGRELPLSEVELELKEGADEALLTFGRDFAARFGLEEEPLSKVASARSLV